MIHSIQKLIQIGSSDGVTIPKKELAKLGATRGDELKITAELVKKAHRDEKPQYSKLMTEYSSFVQEYGQTLKNLSDR